MEGHGVRARPKKVEGRIGAMRLAFFAVLTLFGLRLFFLQVIQGGFYKALAEGQHGFYAELYAKRGDILLRDWADGSEYAVATMAPSGFVFADPGNVKDPENTALILAQILGYPIPQSGEQSQQVATAPNPIEQNTNTSPSVDALVNQLTQVAPDEVAQPSPEQVPPSNEPDPYAQYRLLLARLLKKDDPYEPIQRGVRADVIARIEEAKLPGIHTVDEDARTYPETGIGGQLLGFLGMNDKGERVGLYGIEGFFDDFLKGKNGFLASTTDPSGRWIGIGSRAFERAQDGGDILLTVDRTIQYEACKVMAEGVQKYQADYGAVVIMEPKTGRIIAMCGAPNFESPDYASVEDASVFQNKTVTYPYEPGSVMKPLVAAAALDMGAITPNTTYNDTGEEKIDRFTIRNSDLKANGIQTMTNVLEKSLNTGMIFIMRKMGMDPMQEYLKNYGFGERTGIELTGEARGTLDSLDIKSEIYYATASFGQGVTTTPLQLAVAYSAIANGGYIMRPYIVEEKRYSTGVVEKTQPKVVRQVLSEKAAQQAAAMMVSVVENGHSRTVAMEDYYIAGKTGTAQVPRDDGPGYKPDETKVTFAGFAPLDDPQFVMIVMYAHPRTSQWAEGSASPTWRELADFMLQYFEVTPQR